MAKINNPKKQFQFGIFAAGLNPWTAQTANIPDHEIEQVEHGDTNHSIKTAGRINYGNVTLEKLRPLDFNDNWVWDWIEQCQNAYTGGGDIAEFYKRTITIVQYANDGITITDTWVIEGAWPARINGMSLSRVTSDNSMETVELSVDRVLKTI